MSNDKSLAIIPSTFVEVQSMADVLSKSELLPDALKNKAVDLTFAILTGQELGLAPMASIRGIHIIAGKPVLSADTMVGVILGSGLCEYFVQVEASVTSVTWETKRKGAPIPQRVTWTMDDAKRASLHLRDNWRAYPRAMLASRAKAELARLAYPDVLAGVYDHDEISAIPATYQPSVQPRTAPDAVIDVEFVDVPSTPVAPPPVVASSPFVAIRDAIIADICAASSVAALESILPRFAGLPRDGAASERASAHANYKARLAVLEKLTTTIDLTQAVA